MAKPKLSTKTPDEPELNSLIATHEELILEPKRVRFAIVEIAVPEVKRYTDGDSIATYKITHLEELRGADREAALEIRNRVYSERTGSKTPPATEGQDEPLPGLGDDSV